jgi:S1-C subfamily serine protease
MRGIFTYSELKDKIGETLRYSRILVSGFWIIVILTVFLFSYVGWKYFHDKVLPTPPPSGDRAEYGAVAMVIAEKGQGSAFLLRDGYALTAEHVVKNQKSVRLHFVKFDIEVSAEVLTTHPKEDFALLRVEGEVSKITPLTLGDSDLIEEGEDLIVVGYPNGEWGVTKGTLSLKSAERLKTDAATNPGNSGGPLIYIKENRVIGIIIATRPEAEGMHYAVPINRVKEILKSNNYTL